MTIRKYSPVLLLAALPFAGCRALTEYEKMCNDPDGKVTTKNYPNGIVSFEIKAPSLHGCCVESFTAWMQDGHYRLEAHAVRCVDEKEPNNLSERSLDIICNEKPPYPELGTNYVIRGSPEAKRMERNFYATRLLKEQQQANQNKRPIGRARWL